MPHERPVLVEGLEYMSQSDLQGKGLVETFQYAQRPMDQYQKTTHVPVT